MDYDLHYKLKRGNIRAFRELYEREIRRLWFICYHITQDAKKAVPLLLSGWKQAIEKTVSADSAPREDFNMLFSQSVFVLAGGELKSDEQYETLKEPKISKEYAPFVNAIKQMDYEKRYIYLLTTFGGLNASAVSSLLKQPFEQTKKRISDIYSAAQNTPEIKNMDMRNSIYLSTQFKSPDGKPFFNINIPQVLINALEHDYQVVMKANGKSTTISNVRKETTNMSQTAQKNQKSATKKAGFKYKKPITITAIILVVVIAATILLPKILGGQSASTRITTYNVDEITLGNVSTTISGSGTLNPVTKETLTSTYAGEVESVNFKVGDEVSEDDVIAVIDSDNGDEEITAPCDGIIIELPISVGDEVAMGGSVAMVMGKDGFTMGIAVDELNISSVALDQEVAFTIDAVDGDYTGTVTAISYNGSTSGGTTAFQITATVEYIEGVYPGMSASAQIVIEDSGEGLLVPVDAVGTSGDDNYIYLAPSGAELGTQYEEGKLDLNSLTKVTVETGMSDGTYIMIESDEIAEGDLIIITKITSTLTGSDSDSTGGMSGFPSMDGMDFGDFDFENMDPSNMPSGGSFPGFGN